MLSAVIETVGPFLIPVALFVTGLVGYLFLFVLTRWGVLGDE
jgi:hypothetical protein